MLPAVVVALRLLAQLARPPATPAAMRPAASPPPLVVMGGLYLGVSAARAGLYVLHTLVAPLLVAPRCAQNSLLPAALFTNMRHTRFAFAESSALLHS